MPALAWHIAGALLVVAMLLQYPSTADAAERRLALVIGNNNYSNLRSLGRSIADAHAIAQRLQLLQFEVIYRENADQATMQQALDKFSRELSPDDVAVFYFSGHGAQAASGINYLLSTDTSREDQGIVLTSALEKITRQKPRFALAIIDACRLNPLIPHTRSSDTTEHDGLAAVNPATGMMVIYSAGANQPALDDLGSGDTDQNGLFAREFLKYMTRPGLSISEMMKQVKQSVSAQARAVGFSQMPALYDESTGSFYFVPPGQQAGVAPPLSVTPLNPRPAVDELWDKGIAVSREKNYGEALRWFREAAAGGHPKSMSMIGNFYERGLGVPRDYVEASQWYREAAAKGDATAMHNLGYYYSNGMGVPKDYSEAMQWYLRAVNAGSIVALGRMGNMYKSGWGVPQDYPEAFHWFRKAADAGLVDAMYQVGYFYANGMGVPRDLEKARLWMEKAEAGGSPHAKTWFIYNPRAPKPPPKVSGPTDNSWLLNPRALPLIQQAQAAHRRGECEIGRARIIELGAILGHDIIENSRYDTPEQSKMRNNIAAIIDQNMKCKFFQKMQERNNLKR